MIFGLINNNNIYLDKNFYYLLNIKNNNILLDLIFINSNFDNLINNYYNSDIFCKNSKILSLISSKIYLKNSFII